MKKAVDIFALLPETIRDSVEDEMEEFARELEDNTRSRRDWLDDTGSAAAAITAYLVGRVDPRKNFENPAWRKAQDEGSQKYPGNKPENYRPHIEQIPERGGRNTKIVILTNFVRYAEALEHGVHGYMGGNLLLISAEDSRDQLRGHIVSGIIKGIRWAAK